MPLGNYIASFVVSGTSYGFDPQRGGGYSRGRTLNATVRPVPWPTVIGIAQQVVIQAAGTQPLTRRYQVYFYTEVDFSNMMALVGASGFLTTPREQIAVPCTLMRCESNDSQAGIWDPANPFLMNTSVAIGATLEFQVTG